MMRNALLHTLSGLSLSLAMGGASLSARAVEITITCGPSGSDVEFCWKHAQAWATKTGNTVKNFSPPSSPTEKLALYRQLFAAKSSDIDVVQIDTVWPGLLKDHLADLKPYSKGIEAEHFPAIIANNSVNGKLLGMPWYTDAGLLYYRSDLLKKYGLRVPQTWEELTHSAAKVQAGERAKGDSDFHGFVFQAKAYEGLTCNAIEWVGGQGGGTVVNPDGEITIRNAQAAKALNLAASWVGTISPTGVLNYEEEEARGVFQNSNALFMRNWPYAWALMEKDDSPVKGKVGIAKLPGQPSTAALGGWQLAVSKYSQHPAEAADLVMYMTSAKVQKARAIGNSLNPTLPELYKDKDVIAANAFMANLSDVFANSVARPATLTGLKYPQVSQSVFSAAHEVLSKRATGEEAVKRLEQRLQKIRRKHW
jgi:trehalose/maltose transport system substrate-binding protein